MPQAYAIDTRGPRLGRLLLLVGATSGVALIAGMLALALVTVRHIESTILLQARVDALRGTEFIRARLIQALRQQPGRPASLISAGGDWLEPLLEETVAEDSRLGYAMVVAPDGRVLAHSNPRQLHKQLPADLLRRMAPPAGGGVDEVEIPAPFDHGRVLDFVCPVTLGTSQLGTVHIGVRLDRLEEQRMQTERFVPAVLGITGVLGLLILSGALAVSWTVVGSARRQMQYLMRQQHRADVGNMASGLVHEIRNPLNAIRMQIAVIRRRIDPATSAAERQVAATTLDRLEAEVLRLQRLADDFLAYGGPSSEAEEVFALRPWLEEMAAFLQPDFQRSQMQVAFDADAGTEGLCVRMDRGRLRQVMLNLAANAQQAMGPGGQLTIHLSSPNSRQVRIGVTDTGPGIPPDKVGRIFNLFYTTKPGGSGLGLAIVKQIIENAEGKIRVESRVGQGTSFEIALPLSQGRSPRFLRSPRK